MLPRSSKSRNMGSILSSQDVVGSRELVVPSLRYLSNILDIDSPIISGHRQMAVHYVPTVARVVTTYSRTQQLAEPAVTVGYKYRLFISLIQGRVRKRKVKIFRHAIFCTAGVQDRAVMPSLIFGLLSRSVCCQRSSAS